MKTALIVDDEIVVVRALKRRIEWNRFGIGEVFEAHSMKQAMEVFKEHEIDILISDIEMPEGTGLELFEWVKGYFPYVECIYITCHPDFEYIRTAMRLGSFDYLLKPIDYEELYEVMRRAVDRVETNSLLKKRVHKKARASFSGEMGQENGNTDTIDTIKKYIRNHIQEEISMSDIAEVVYLNPQYMVRMFRKQEGISILEYITDTRIELASKLLRETNDSINQVAGLVGYANYSYFSRVYKKVTGMTPQEYKKEYGKEN